MSEPTVRSLPSSICCHLWQLIFTRWNWILVCDDKGHHDHILHNCWSDIWLGRYQRSSRACRSIHSLTCTTFFSTQSFMEGLSNFKNGQAFIGGFSAFASNFVYAFYSFGGVELVAVAAGESAKPYKSVPRAIKATFFRVVLFYILTMLTIGLCINHADPTLPNTGSKFLSSFIRSGYYIKRTLMARQWSSCLSCDCRFPSCRFWGGHTRG